MSFDFLNNPDLFRYDALSKLVGVFSALFFVMVVIYSFGYMRGRKGLFRYYLFTVLTFVATLAAVFANNMIIFLSVWGFLGLLLFLLIGMGRSEGTPAAAKKAFIIIGGSDALMLLGIVILWQLSGSSDPMAVLGLRMDALSQPLGGNLALLGYLCLAAGALAKAGAVPFHTWVPDTAENAPIPVTAFLPASLDKLLGVYLLARVSLGIFQSTPTVNFILMAVGSVGIVVAVMMALVQKDMKRLLGYDAVSQVGYMVLGIGTGNPIGIAGALFHMLNVAIYKSGLFLAAGAVEKRTGTSDLSKLGGLAKTMPVTFGIFLLSALATAGVPPLNGFASKWMIYQGVIEVGRSGAGGSQLWILWLIAAIFGSALTLAVMMKLTHAVFLGQPSSEVSATLGERKRPGFLMTLPSGILALLCVVFGVFAISIPLKLFVYPSVPREVAYPGIWSSGLATILLLVGVVIGFLIYLMGSLRKARVVEPFVGGEKLSSIPEMRVSGAEFYDTVRKTGFLRGLFRAAEKKLFDLYDLLAGFVSWIGQGLGALHNGILPRYLTWFLVGMVVLFYVLIR